MHYTELAKGVVYSPSLDKFIAAKCDNKVAVLQQEYESERFYALQDTINKLPEDVQIIIISMELHIESLVFMKKNSSKRFTYIIGGILNDQLQVDAKLLYNSSWLVSTGSFYNRNNKHLSHTKEYHFEIMYGVSRYHRVFVNDNVSHFRDKIFETPFLKTSSVSTESISPGDLWEDDIIHVNSSRVEFNGHVMLPSQVMPYKIYNKAAYSIVCETNYHNWFSFFTEKIAKPLTAGRLFIIISGQHYLRNLRSLGFKTFGDVVDESYDEIENQEERWLAAIDSAHQLTLLPQDVVLTKCNDIFEHNKQVISKMDRVEITLGKHLKEIDFI